MRSLVFLSIVLSCLAALNASNELSETRPTKNILVFIFPGGKSHHFIFKEIISFMLKRPESQNFDYKFTLIIHNFDKDLWKNSEHTILGYGNLDNYEEHFYKAMELAKDDPVFGYNNFNSAMKHMYRDFLLDGILLKLKGLKFDLILSDITNLLTTFLSRELNIPKRMYVNPTCMYTWMFASFEYNASYNPMIGTTFSHDMNFVKRFANQFIFTATKIMYTYFSYSQNQVFKEFGYTEFIQPFEQHAMYLNQCVNGVHFPVSLPPNMISTGPFLPRPAKQVDNPIVDEFLNKYKRNIYVSQGTITKAINPERLGEVFEHFPDIGFVVSLKKQFHLIKFPSNVLQLEWVSQNDLLGDSRIVGFLTHGGINSLLESIYHAKPMVVIGTGIDQVNGAVVVDSRRLGVGITSTNDITPERLIQGLEVILQDQTIKENIKFASELVRETDGKEVFTYWFNYIMEHGYDHLLIPAYSKYSYIQLYNYDVFVANLVILYFVFKLLSLLTQRFLRLFFK